MEGNFGPMDRKMRPQDDNAKIQHAYKKYENTPQWHVVNDAIDALVKNGDIQETTNRVYIVGFLCKMLAARGLP